MKNTQLIETIVAILLVIGGLDLGFIGLFRWDLIATVFGEMTSLTRIIYVLVGLAGVYRVVVWLKSKAK